MTEQDLRNISQENLETSFRTQLQQKYEVGKMNVLSEDEKNRNAYESYVRLGGNDYKGTSQIGKQSTEPSVPTGKKDVVDEQRTHILTESSRHTDVPLPAKLGRSGSVERARSTSLSGSSRNDQSKHSHDGERGRGEMRRKSRRSSHSRERDSQRSRHRRRSSRSRSHSRSCSRSRSRRDEKDRSRSRSRSRSKYARSHKHSRRSRSRSRSRSRDGRGSRYGRRRDYSPRKRVEEKKRAVSPSPQLTEAERDRRTVFVQQLAARLKSQELEEFLGRVGKVRDVRICTDRVTGRSKGFGYVEFYEEHSVPMAILLSGEKLLGIPIMIEYTETEKNRIAEEALEASKRAYRPSDVDYLRLYVGSIHPNITEENLRLLFEPYGDIDTLQLHRDPLTQRSKGFAFVQYKEHAHAKKALEQLNGLELAGTHIRVGVVSEKSNGGSGSGGSGGHASSALDDSDTQGLAMTAQSRTDLMMKLARDTDLVGQVMMSLPPTTMTGLSNDPTVYILMTNVYDPELETDPEWAKDLSEDIYSECTKFGPVQHLQITKSKAGEVYVKFADLASAELAVAALSGRWFGGRQIGVRFISATVFQARLGRV